ncbi:MAG: archaeosortase/exosortase family protein [Planctomycetota bacterium]|jgi:exosortase/archaeosortase family protein
MKRPVFIILLLVLATMPTWVWSAKRMSDRSDEPWGLLALATFIAFVCWKVHQKTISANNPNLMLPALVMFVYAVTYPFVMPLCRGILAMTVLALIVSRLYFNRTCHMGLFGLAMLSLPLLASLQFYLGYPMRVLAGNLAVAMLRMTGYAVVRDGVGLLFGDHTVLIDAPCSGVKMLWVGCYLIVVLSCVWDIGLVKTFIAGLFGIIVIIIGNALRVASLFYTEIGMVNIPEWGHNVVGMIVFAITATAVVIVMQRLYSIRGRLA